MRIAGEGNREAIPRNVAKDGVVSAAWKGNGEVVTLDGDSSLTLNEVSIKLRGIAILEATEVTSKHVVQSVSDHGHGHIEVDLDEDRRRERIEMKELDGF